MEDAERKRLAAALSHFNARKAYVAELVILFDMAVDENGTIVETNECKTVLFFDALDEWDRTH